MNLRRLLALATVLLLPPPSAVHAADYQFDGKVGGEFEPEEFDLNEVNKKLEAIR
jgi:hypothetical protein